MTDFPGRDRGVKRPVIAVLVLMAMATGVTVLCGPSEVAVAATGAPSITITPAPTGGRFADGATVRVSVEANSVYTPLSRVVILECADPGGDAAHLPISISTCDENTVQGDTTVVAKDGSFVESSYTMYALPSKTLGEQANAQPVCSPTSECVLFVGENQNDFTLPKAFSNPFLMSPATPTVAPVPVAGASSAAPQPAGPSAQVSLNPTTLAFTGPSNWFPALGVSGVGLALLGLATRRWGRRVDR